MSRPVLTIGVFICLTTGLGGYKADAAQRIAILPFEVRFEFKGPWDIGRGIPAVFGDTLGVNLFYSIIPPDTIAKVLTERELKKGKFKEARALEIGRSLGADYVFTGGIDRFTIGRFRAGVPFGGYNAFKAYAEIEVRIFNVISGQEVGLITGESEVADRGVGISYRSDDMWKRSNEFAELANYDFGSKEFRASLMGEALMEALGRLKDKVEEAVEPPPELRTSSPTVLWVEGDYTYVNIGLEDGVEIGDKLGVYIQGEELRDPRTGAVLGRADDRRVGTIQIITIKAAHLSKARILDGIEQIKAGQIVRTE